MNSKKILIFDIGSEYGHFRKYNTTTSPLTYSIPTRTAIIGVIGAILGIERELAVGQFPDGIFPLQELFSKAKADIAVQILNPVRKENIAINLLNTKFSFYDLSKAGRTQIEFEMLKNPRYRIFFGFSGKREIFDELIERVKTKKHHFSPYLGLAQFTATVDFVAVETANYIENTNKEYVEILSAVNLALINDAYPVEFDYSALYSANNMPMVMNRYREVQEFSEILIEKNGAIIKAKPKVYYKVNNFGNILFL